MLMRILYDCFVLCFPCVVDAMSYVWGVAFGKDIGAEKTPRSLSARWVSTVYAFMALILVNTYSANLMANLLQEDYVLPIKGIKDPKVFSRFVLLIPIFMYPASSFSLAWLFFACFFFHGKPARLTSDANHFVNAKSHARKNPLLAG